MSGKHDDSVKYAVLNCDRVDGILSMLDALQSTAQGRVIYQQLEHALRDLSNSQNKITLGYAKILDVILESYRQHLPKTSLIYLEVKLAQKRLKPPITLNELAILHAYLKNVVKLTSPMFEPSEEIIREALRPIIGEEVASADLIEDASIADVADNIILEPEIAVDRTPPETKEPVQGVESSPSVELRVNSLFQQRLNKHYQEIQSLQSSLLKKINDTGIRHQKFSQELQNALLELEKYAENTEFEDLRRNIVRVVRSLLDEQSELLHIIGDTQSYLSLISDNSQKLSEELDQVRVLSLTDDLTGLPNRRAFLRRTEDEIGRSERDKTTLTLITIDLDFFKSINDKYGHTVGDNILRLYASDVLSIFRRYDMVSRYGGEEFAVLLPNTDRQGAQRALLKIQSKVARMKYEHEGHSIDIPTFSAGVAIHRNGESMQTLIERADKALYSAKQQGRNRIEFAEHDKQDMAETKI